MPSGETIGPRPGAQPMKWPSGSCTPCHAMPSNPGWPSLPSRRREHLVRIDADDGVMNRRAVGPEFHRANEHVRLERRVRITRLRYTSSVARLELIRPRRRERRDRACRAASRRATRAPSAGRRAAFALPPFDPALDRLDLVVAQPALADDRKLAAIGEPRRHVTASRFRGHGVGVLHGVGVSQERKRRDFARPMARRAVGEHDRRDVLIEGDRWRRGGWCGGPTAACRSRRDRERRHDEAR